jgi:alpha-glucosidase
VWGGPAWEWDEATGQSYLHLFLPEMPDLNWRNPEVRAAMFDVVRFWMDRGVDGLRIDVAEVVMKHPDLPDNPPNRRRVRSYKQFGNWDDQLHIHDVGHPDVHDVYRDLRAILDAYGDDRLAIGEIHIFELEQWARYYGESLDELHLPFNFGLLTVEWTAAAVRRSVDRLEAALPDGAWPNFVLGNHDESRVATRLGPERARLAMMLLLTLRGTPTIYYGDELGMTDVDVPPERRVDPQGLRLSPDMSRDPARSPMPWRSGEGAGFTEPGVRPWLPLGTATADVAAQLADPASMLALTRHLLRLRRRTAALAAGAYTPLDAPAGCFLFVRSHGDDRVVIALNFTAEAVAIELDTGTEILASTTPGRDGRSGPELVLEPHEGRVLRPFGPARA